MIKVAFWKLFINWEVVSKNFVEIKLKKNKYLSLFRLNLKLTYMFEIISNVIEISLFERHHEYQNYAFFVRKLWKILETSTLTLSLDWILNVQILWFNGQETILVASYHETKVCHYYCVHQSIVIVLSRIMYWLRLTVNKDGQTFIRFPNPRVASSTKAKNINLISKNVSIEVTEFFNSF